MPENEKKLNIYFFITNHNFSTGFPGKEVSFSLHYQQLISKVSSAPCPMNLTIVKGPTSFGGGSALLRASLGGQLRPAPYLPAHLRSPFASLFLLS